MYNLADNAPAIFKICSFIIILKNIIVHNKQKSVNRHPPFNRSGALVMLGARRVSLGRQMTTPWMKCVTHAHKHDYNRTRKPNSKEQSLLTAGILPSLLPLVPVSVTASHSPGRGVSPHRRRRSTSADVPMMKCLRRGRCR